jgi:nucleotide-binding universal stress UspA family protein
LDLLKKEGKESEPVISRIRDILLDTIALGPRESGPPPGQWREEVQSIHPDERLFIDILVPVSGESNSWFALDQAALIAQREGARLHGLHIMLDSMESKEADTEKFQGEFVRRCQEQNVQGHLIISTGEVAREISSQARLTDLVVVTLLHPPPSQLVRRLDSGFRELIMLCPRPVLAVPQVVSPLQHALLAYDGSPKADEALFVAAYLAGTWKIRLTVLTIFEGNRVAPETLLRAKMYLEEKSIEAQFVSRDGAIAETILAEADTAQADLIVMGGYGFNPLLNVILGSAVDQVLRESSKPVLICR